MHSLPLGFSSSSTALTRSSLGLMIGSDGSAVAAGEVDEEVVVEVEVVADDSVSFLMGSGCCFDAGIERTGPFVFSKVDMFNYVLTRVGSTNQVGHRNRLCP